MIKKKKKKKKRSSNPIFFFFIGDSPWKRKKLTIWKFNWKNYLCAEHLQRKMLTNYFYLWKLQRKPFTPKEPIHKFFAFFHVQFLKIIYLCQKIKSNNNNNQVLVPIFPNKLKYTKNEIQSESQFGWVSFLQRSCFLTVGSPRLITTFILYYDLEQILHKLHKQSLNQTKTTHKNVLIV